MKFFRNPASEICRRCRFWFVYDDIKPVEDLSRGDCRRHAPAATGLTAQTFIDMRRWPQVRAIESCGDFEPASDADLDARHGPKG